MLCAYVVTIGFALALLFLVHATAPRWMGRSGEASLLFLLLNVAIWAISAMVGGMLIGWIAQWNPIIVAFGLACALFSAILSVAMRSIGRTSLNYQVAVAACAAIGALNGCLLMQILHLHITTAL